mmetsp:Transcript_27431/g.31454  ORF Transcript_27431/g.31454 Transcript_27431/m.31454 type:complete len:161 (-) Transcript_27431:260-742(-)
MRGLFGANNPFTWPISRVGGDGDDVDGEVAVEFVVGGERAGDDVVGLLIVSEELVVGASDGDVVVGTPLGELPLGSTMLGAPLPLGTGKGTVNGTVTGKVTGTGDDGTGDTVEFLGGDTVGKSTPGDGKGVGSVGVGVGPGVGLEVGILILMLPCSFLKD